MKLRDKVYIAGLFDGEGTISICKHKNYYNLYVHIWNTNLRVIKWIKKVTNLGIITHNNSCWNLQTSHAKGEKFLKIIYPYLRIKKDQAKLAFKFQNTKHSHNQPLTNREKELRKEYKNQMAILNHRKGLY